MADELRVDPLVLRTVSAHVSVAASDHATETAGHLDNLTDAVSRWRGESKVALQELAERWEGQNAAHQARVTALREKVSEAAERYTAVDSASGEDIESTPIIGSEDTGGPELDLGL